jgi:hypothetical protein
LSGRPAPGSTARHPVDLDELELICIDPLPSCIWCQGMADFVDQISDERAGRRLARAIEGKAAFRRFKAHLHEEHPQLLPAGTPFAMPVHAAAQSSGSPTTCSSTTTRPRASSTSTPRPMWRDPDSRLR